MKTAGFGYCHKKLFPDWVLYCYKPLAFNVDGVCEEAAEHR